MKPLKQVGQEYEQWKYLKNKQDLQLQCRIAPQGKTFAVKARSLFIGMALLWIKLRKSNTKGVQFLRSRRGKQKNVFVPSLVVLETLPMRLKCFSSCMKWPLIQTSVFWKNENNSIPVFEALNDTNKPSVNPNKNDLQILLWRFGRRSPIKV